MALAIALKTASATGQAIVDRSQDCIRVYFTVTPSGSYAAGGDPLDLSLLNTALASGGPGGAPIPSGSLPIIVRLRSAALASVAQTNMFEYNYAPGTTLANGKMQLFTGAAAQTALTEFTAGSYPAGVLADAIVGEAVFPAM